jgi:hypothetical protein
MTKTKRRMTKGHKPHDETQHWLKLVEHFALKA